MRIECRDDEAAFDALEEAWEALHERSATATIFNSVPYARLWWRHFGVPEALQLWTVWDNETLVGVAPLYETPDERGAPARRFVGGVEVSDYLDVVAEPGWEAAVVAALLERWADAPCRCPLDLRAIRDASPTREAFLRLAPEWGFFVAVEQEAVCPVIVLPGSWEAYLEGLDRKLRHELRRKLRKAGQEALVSMHHVPAALVAEEMEDFFRLHALSSPEKAAFMTPTMRAFFRDLAVTFSQRGWLDLVYLSVDGVRAATHLNFRFRDEVQLYNGGHDSSIREGLSPGWLLLCYCIEEAIAEGQKRFDFLQGDEDYKFRFGARAEAVWHLTLNVQRANGNDG
ncbi:MAG: GNAT family N-acetyltransferase [Ardenticatenaceae bacterium]